MPFNLKYKLTKKANDVLLNKRYMLVLALSAPIIFTIGALYLADFFNNVKLPFNSTIHLGINNQIHSNKLKGNVTITNDISETSPTKSVFSHNLQPLFTDATEMKVENVNMDIKLTKVGVDDAGILEVPQNWKEGGWYKYGSRPGEIGNVIINAHYDDNYGRPAAFWELKNVKADDKVLLLDKYGKIYTYSVKDSYLVSINDPDRLKIFEDSEDKATLTLITCGGIWLPGKSTYDKRLVVKAELLNN
jgi:sortase A